MENKISDGRKRYVDSLTIDQLKTRTAKARSAAVAQQVKTFEVTSPQGDVSTIKNLKEFCLTRSLDDSAMNKVANGKANHHKGWKCRRIEDGQVVAIDETALPETRQRLWIVIAPDGKEQEITNLKNFCEKNNLSYFNMKEVAYGRLDTVNGWRVK